MMHRLDRTIVAMMGTLIKAVYFMVGVYVVHVLTDNINGWCCNMDSVFGGWLGTL